MQIKILVIGKVKDAWIREGIREYQKRLSPYCRLEIQELAEEKLPENPSLAQVEKGLEKEGERLLKALPEDYLPILLDLHGKSWSSEELAAKMDEWALNGKSQLAFLIGGAFGLSGEVRKKAKERLQLSKMTFTHTMTRLILVEQIYRAFKICRHEKYHW
jgi:rRNA large subunit m3Psi methyltransferase RlmH